MATSTAPAMSAAPAMKYRPILEIGQGGMSRVYLAVSQGPGGFNKLQVVKRLLPELANDPEFLAMFLEEARLSARLNHSNVVQINEVGFDGQHYFMAMEYLEGQSAEGVVRRAAKKEGFPVEMYLRVIAEAAAGLHYAHELADIDGKPLNIVHRDISPHNIFVTYQGQVKVLDFGIAKAADSSQHTRTGVLKGKVAYMAPEQFADAKSVDRRADIFALGVMAFQAAAQTRMWKGLSEMEILQRLATNNLPQLEEVAPALDPKLRAVIAKALAPAPADRYATAQEFADALEGHLDEMRTNPNPKDIGKFVTALFADTRAKVSQQVEAALRRVQQGDGSPNSTGEIPALTESQRIALPASGSDPGSDAGGRTQLLDAGVRPSGSHQVGGLTETTGNTKASVVSVPQPQEEQKKKPLVLAFVGIGIVAAGAAALAFAFLRPQPPPVKPATDSTVTSTASASGSTADSKYTSLTVEGSPSESSFFVDGSLLGSNPGKARLPRDGASHSIRAEAPGFETESQSVVFDSADKLVSFHLAPKETGKSGTPKNGGGVAATAPTHKNGTSGGTTSGGGTAEVPTQPTTTTTVAPPVTATPTAATAPTASVAAPTVPPGTIDKKAVNATVRAHTGQVQECYDRAKMNQPDLHGSVTVTAQIAPSGSVSSAQVAGTTANSTRLEQCLVGAFRSWTFPQPTGGVAGNVSFTFKFE